MRSNGHKVAKKIFNNKVGGLTQCAIMTYFKVEVFKEWVIGEVIINRLIEQNRKLKNRSPNLQLFDTWKRWRYK